MFVIKQTFKMSLLVIKLNFLNVQLDQQEPSNMENGEHIHWTLGGRDGGVDKKWIVIPCTILWKGLTNNLRSEKYIQNWMPMFHKVG